MATDHDSQRGYVVELGVAVQQSVARLIGLQGDDPAARRQRGVRRLLNYRDGRDAGKTRAASRLALRGQIAA